MSVAAEQQVLRDQIAALDEQAAEIARQRAVAVAGLEELELQASSHGHPEKRAKLTPAGETPDVGSGAPEPRRSSCEPKSWRHLSKVQEEVAAKRAAGALLPFGTPGRLPRVYVDGCFDMMHSGHMNAVRQAKLIADSVGGLLVVGVHTDAEIELNKGPPVMRDAERIALVAAVKWVDELIFDTPYTNSLPFLDSIDCEYCVHGDDMPVAADGSNAYGEAKKAGRLKVVKRTEGVSTTDLVGRLLLFSREHHTPSVGPSIAATHVGAPPPRTTDGAATTDGYAEQNVSSSGVSQFLPTTMRLRAFSNGRVALPTERIVYVAGAFDLLHAGHVAALYNARQHGDFLLVGLHDDATVHRACGRNHPIATLHERALCVLALGCVDEVILGAPAIISADLINSMNIHVVVGGCDEAPAAHSGDRRAAEATAPPEVAPASPLQSVEASAASIGPADPYAVPKAKGLYVACTKQPVLRLADIVERIITNRQRFEARNAKRERKELDYVLNQKVYVEEL